MSITLNQKILVWVRAQLGTKVDRGECWDLAELALKKAGAKTSNDLGDVGPDTDYVWGKAVTDPKDALPGDIIQFRNYTESVRVDTDQGWTTESRSTPHHTAIIDKLDTANGLFVLLEQNVAPQGKVVQRNSVRYKNGVYIKRLAAGKSIKTTVKVTGKFWVYRPLGK